MNYTDIVHLVNTDPVAQILIESPVAMRLGYVGLDGHPRTVPVAYLWNGKAFVFASPTTAYKVRAIAAHPQVSFSVDTYSAEVRDKVVARLGPTVSAYTPVVMLVRGTASIEVRPGVPDEHVQASWRMFADKSLAPGWEQQKRAHTTDMALITIIPTHVTLCDFVTRFPPPVEVNAPAHDPAHGANDSCSRTSRANSAVSSTTTGADRNRGY
ncbi:pyridoxamine 5'-phosphate oxidase [Micromonospora sp. HNM0581]|uniref:pyridoxamine 5'-phosphate oxidase family protein n=1 Tax=Micromonospora sp. HNM0581 TaxID=2716341 RepID=UPI00146C9895|nr:pyridoxamine 5'-phosphate oxidase family protein [Micromonospora sp. HNM0581]NLU79152.1 pyridoxamine 5'-phosphate oxidase [Micromonospora sp. HNM0581]